MRKNTFQSIPVFCTFLTQHQRGLVDDHSFPQKLVETGEINLPLGQGFSVCLPSYENFCLLEQHCQQQTLILANLAPEERRCLNRSE